MPYDGVRRRAWNRRGLLWTPADVPLSPTVRAARSVHDVLVLPQGTLFSSAIPETNATVSAAGTTVTASATANTKGAWTSLIDPTTGPSYGIWVRAMDVHVSATITNMLLDIGYGPTGGGSETILLPDLQVGCSADHTTVVGGREYFFPVYVPAGTRVSARCAAAVVSDTVLVQVQLLKQPMYPVLVGPVSAYGVDAANSRGTSVTPGNSTFGTWTLLAAGPLNRPHTHWYAALDQLADTTLVDDRYNLVQLGIGPDNANVTPIFQGHCGEEGTEAIDSMFPVAPQYAPTIADAAADLWARIAQTAAAEARGIIAYGMD